MLQGHLWSCMLPGPDLTLPTHPIYTCIAVHGQPRGQGSLADLLTSMSPASSRWMAPGTDAKDPKTPPPALAMGSDPKETL